MSAVPVAAVVSVQHSDGQWWWRWQLGGIGGDSLAAEWCQLSGREAAAA